jgi:hypothetical protein
MPFSADGFAPYISLDRIISPFPAFRWKKNSPFFAFLISNFATIASDRNIGFRMPRFEHSMAIVP